MGVYLAQPKKDKNTKEGSGANFKYVVSEMQGWRKTMEDSSISEPKLTDDISLFGTWTGGLKWNDGQCRNENVFAMSEDHKPDNELEKDRITKAGGVVANGRINMNLNLSRAIGDLEYKRNNTLKDNEQLIISEPDIQIKEMSDQDEFILMGCDGIWETLSQEEIVAFFKKKINENADLKETIEEYLEKAIAPNTSYSQAYRTSQLRIYTLERYNIHEITIR